MLQDDSPPRIEIQDAPDGPVVRLLGAWTAANLTVPAVWAALTAQLKGLGGGAAKTGKAARAVAGHWRLDEIEKLDYLGAQVLWQQWDHQWPTALQVTPEQREMLEAVEKFTVKLAPAPRASWFEPVRMLGGHLLNLFDHSKGLLQLLGVGQP